jgi:DNA-binding XRE family transcriptional regulator
VRVRSSGRGCCTRCQAPLRRARPRGEAWCDPCRRAGPDPRRDVPPGFYFQDPIAAALADYDFATVFHRVRAITGWSQQTLAALVGLDQGRISAIERGVRRLRDVAVVAQVATALWIPRSCSVSAPRGLPWARSGLRSGRW